ncbi:MAG TPA: TolC family protein [Gemmataceae bacterium]|nr:TolC family protein [Gemmataceae bacterium]
MIRLFWIPALVLVVGCRTDRADLVWGVADPVHSFAAVRAPSGEVAPTGRTTFASGPDRLELDTLWELVLANNPALREAEADVEVARGRLVQAGLYPNPRVLYEQSVIGSRAARQGNGLLQVNQEIVTGGKRELDQAVAERETSAAAVAMVGRKFEVLTQLRRAYYDYRAFRAQFDVSEQSVRSLEGGVEVTRRQVETAKTRPQTDLVRLEALLEEAKIGRARAEELGRAAWRQVVALVGVSDLPQPAPTTPADDRPPEWDEAVVLHRVIEANTAIKQAAVEAERARLAVERATAEQVPNVTVGAGYVSENVDRTAGPLLSIELPLPVWDRRQGAIHEARARQARAQAAIRSAETRLRHDTAEALGRYQAARVQVDRLTRDVLPRLTKSLELLRSALAAGSGQVTFGDVLMTEQNLNATRLTLTEAKRSLWLAVADLEGLMQLDVGETLTRPAR